MKPSRRKATLIVLAWNRWELTRRCLDTLVETDLRNTEVIVVDNGSTDETPRELERYRSWIRVLTNPQNLGYVRGNNAGIDAADPASDIVLLNNDLEFHQSDWLQTLRACAHSSDSIGIAGCRLILPDGRLLHAGTYILPDTMWGQQIGALQKDIGQYTRVRDVEGIVFACAYLRRETIETIGPLSLDYESYFEDTDYCLRARQHGLRTVLCGDVTLVHAEHGSTGDDTGHLMRLFEASREIFRAKWSAQLEGRYSTDLIWQSIMNFPTGYAMSCREILRALDTARVRTAYRYVYGPGTVFRNEEPEESGDYLLNVVRQRRPRPGTQVAVVYGQGDVFERNEGKRKVGFTMLEVDGFPEEWVRQANEMDEVWVPSDFNAQGFIRSGLKRPVHVIPLGIDPDFFHPTIRGYPNPLGEYVFLSNFEWVDRKDPWTLLKVFNDEFSASEPVRLVCKVLNRDPDISVSDEIRRLDLKPSGGKINFIFNRVFPFYELGSLYRSADCYVSVSRGEGWDMPLMEAMACGLPSIATDWGAHQMFVNDRVSYPLRVRGTIPAVSRNPNYRGFSWADPDSEHLRHLLRYVFEHQEEARRLGAAASLEVTSRFTWDHTAHRIRERLEALLGA